MLRVEWRDLKNKRQDDRSILSNEQNSQKVWLVKFACLTLWKRLRRTLRATEEVKKKKVLFSCFQSETVWLHFGILYGTNINPYSKDIRLNLEQTRRHTLTWWFHGVEVGTHHALLHYSCTLRDPLHGQLSTEISFRNVSTLSRVDHQGDNEVLTVGRDALLCILLLQTKFCSASSLGQSFSRVEGTKAEIVPTIYLRRCKITPHFQGSDYHQNFTLTFLLSFVLIPFSLHIFTNMMELLLIVITWCRSRLRTESLRIWETLQAVLMT